MKNRERRRIFKMRTDSEEAARAMFSRRIQKIVNPTNIPLNLDFIRFYE